MYSSHELTSQCERYGNSACGAASQVPKDVPPRALDVTLEPYALRVAHRITCASPAMMHVGKRAWCRGVCNNVVAHTLHGNCWSGAEFWYKGTCLKNTGVGCFET